ncbi:MAG: glycosyltransferase [Desulfonauticus sp.]|nr:glycosyltransferase [Desulfonauticus sp.]
MELIKIFSFPLDIAANPYLKLFYNSLKEYGYVHAGGLVVNDLWLKGNKKNIDILHFNWPEDIWRLRGRNKFSKLRGVLGFWKYLDLARKFNIKIWWTLHNLEHHEGVDIIDRFAYLILARKSDIIICHSRYSASELRKRYKNTGKTVIMYHGLYEGVYPEPNSKEKIIKTLNLDPDIPIFSCLGNIRYYKGFDLAAKAISTLEQRVQLIIAGNVHPSYDISVLEKIIKNSKNKIILIPKFLSDQEFSDIMSISDAIILPYRKITTSGLLLAAWSFLKPVIVSDHPYFRELTEGYPNTAFFFSPKNYLELQKTLQSFLETDKNLIRSEILSLKKRYSWKECVKALISALGS